MKFRKGFPGSNHGSDSMTSRSSCRSAGRGDEYESSFVVPSAVLMRNGTASRVDEIVADIETSSWLRPDVPIVLRRLEEAANRFACDAEADDLAGLVDFGDRVRRHEPAVTREETALHGECVRNVRERPVHRALDLADHPTAVVGDEEPACGREIQGESGHVWNLFPVSNENPLHGVKVLLGAGLPTHGEHRDEKCDEIDAGDDGHRSVGPTP